MRFALFSCATAWSAPWQPRGRPLPAQAADAVNVHSAAADRVETFPSALSSVRPEQRTALRRAPIRAESSPDGARWPGMAPLLIVALGLSGSSHLTPAVKAAIRTVRHPKKAKRRRWERFWEPVANAKTFANEKTGNKRRRAKISGRSGIRGHMVPQAAPDAIREAVGLARKELLDIARERSFLVPVEAEQQEEGSAPATTPLKSHKRRLLADIAETMYFDVEADEFPVAPAGSNSSKQARLAEQSFKLWPALSRKLSYMNSEDRSMVWRALCVACASAATNGQEDLLERPSTVAMLLAGLELDVATVAAGLLHNVLEETELTTQDLTLYFSEEVSTIVAGCTKVSKLRGMPPHALTDEEQAENLREMLLAMADDSRVILLKCAVRLYEMRTLSTRDLQHRERTAIAQETLDIFVPLAGKSGIYAIKGELADLAFKHLEPVEYRNFSESVDKYTEKSDAELGLALKWLSERVRGDELLKAHCATVQLSGRIKNLYSIWQKTHTLASENETPVDVNDITDIYAARLVIDYQQQPWESEEEYRNRGIALCYHVIGLMDMKLWTEVLSIRAMEDVFRPTWTVSDKFKDYIAVPKPNGYQSLHTVVMNKLPVEVQVRTNWMHVSAEYGIASHWLYKDQQAGLTKLPSYKSAFLDPLKKLNSEIVDSRTFMDSVRKELLGKRTFVYLPDNRILNIPRGSSALDAAFKIHSDIGIYMKRAIVNGESVHAATQLQNGDRIFIETAEQPQVDETWLESAWTRSTLAKVRQYLRMQDQMNELRAHLKEKELRDDKDSPLGLVVVHDNSFITHEGIPHELIGKQMSQAKYKMLSENTEGEVRRTHSAEPAKEKAGEPEYALM
jgi:GTP pyrophosphokinase